MSLSPFLSINHSCDETLQWTKEKLLQAGLHPVQTFDLHAAWVGLHDCSCPHHGTEDCNCQMVILLVYGDVLEPVTLILHGNDEQTWLSLEEAADQQMNVKIQTAVRQTLNVNTTASVVKGT